MVAFRGEVDGQLEGRKEGRKEGREWGREETPVNDKLYNTTTTGRS